MTTPVDKPSGTDELSFGFGGKTLAIRGAYSAVIVVILSLVIFQGWMLWDYVSNARQRAISSTIELHDSASAKEHQTLKQAIDAQTDVLKEQKQLQEEQNYMLFFASPKEKDRLSQRVRQPTRFRELLNENGRHQ